MKVSRANCVDWPFLVAPNRRSARKEPFLVAKIRSNSNVDKKLSFQVRVDIGWWKILNQLHILTKRSLKGLVEDSLSNTYSIDEKGEPYVVER